MSTIEMLKNNGVLREVRKGGVCYLEYMSYLVQREEFEPIEVESILIDEFIRRVNSKFDTTDSAIYLNNIENKSNKNGKQINIFDSIHKTAPFKQIIESVVCEVVKVVKKRRTQKVTWINIGIGRGILEEKILDRLSVQEKESLQIIGIDIDIESLSYTKELILKISPHTQYYCFHKPIEEFYATEWESIKRITENSQVYVGAILTLHHLKRRKERLKVLKNLSEFIEPDEVFLVEADSDHFTNNYTKRVYNCRKHFSAVFNMLKQQKEDGTINDKEYLQLTSTFFKREIRDILNKNDNSRTEKHELLSTWKRRLEKAGFRIINQDIKLPENLDIKFVPPSTVCDKFNNIGILGLIRAKHVEKNTVISASDVSFHVK